MMTTKKTSFTSRSRDLTICRSSWLAVHRLLRHLREEASIVGAGAAGAEATVGGAIEGEGEAVSISEGTIKAVEWGMVHVAAVMDRMVSVEDAIKL